MKLIICLVALGVCSVKATPAPQIFQPLTPFGTWLQNSFQTFPRPTIFQNGPLNPFRPQTQVQVAPSQQVVPTTQQVTPTQANGQWPQSIQFPDRQSSNNGWYWQNWIPLPIIPQYGQDQAPTIIIISRPAKQPAQNASSNTITSSGSTAAANSSSIQSTNISLVIPSTNDSSNSLPVAVSNSSEPSTSSLSSSSVAQTSPIAQSPSNLDSGSGEY